MTIFVEAGMDCQVVPIISMHYGCQLLVVSDNLSLPIDREALVMAEMICLLFLLTLDCIGI